MKPNRKNLFLRASAAIDSCVNSTPLKCAVAAVVLGGAMTQWASAATYYWDSTPTPADPGFGTAAGSWSSQSVTSGNGRWTTSATGILSGNANQTTTNADTFNYGTATDALATGSITIGGTLAAPINVGSITFGAASGTITLNGGFLAFGATKTITVNNMTNTISSVIQGSNGFNKNGAGELILTGNNTHSGVTTVSNNGALTLSGNNSAMSGGVTLSTNTGVSPRLNINSATAIGTGTLNFGGGAATDTVRLDNTSVGGAVTLSTNNALTLNRNFTFIGTQSLNLGTGAATLGGLTAGTNRAITVTANTLTLGGNIGEAALNLAITKAGAGTLVLGGANTFSGVTTINNSGGILRITNAGALGSGDVFIGTQATNTGTLELSLTGTNSITNNFTTNSANTLTTVGANAHILNTSGTNTISGNLTVTGGGGNGLNVASNGGLLTLSGTITSTTSTTRTLSLGGSGNGLVSGAIVDQSGFAFSVQKSGAGTWTLSNSLNTYTGATTISGGTLKFGNNNVIADTSAVTVGGTATTGTLDIAGFSETLGTSAVATMLSLGINSTTVGGLQNQVINSGGSAVLAVDGGIQYNAGAGGFNNGKALISADLQMGVTSAVDRNFTVNDSTATVVDLEITGVVSSGTNGVGKSGAGTLFLNNDANTFTGQFLMNAGTVQVTKLADGGSNSSLGTGSDNSLIRLSDVSNATLEYVGSADSSTDRRFLLGTNSGASTNSTILNNGLGKLTFSSSGFNNPTTSVIARTLTLGGSNTSANTITGAIIDNAGVGGTVGVTKQDAGKWILNGANTYSGATTINGGTLALGATGSIVNSPTIIVGASTTFDVSAVSVGYTLGAAQTLAGNGTVLATGKTVLASGTLAPGASPGTLTQDGGSLQLAVGGDYNWQILNAAGAAGTGYDTTSLINGATLNLSLLSAGNTYNINLWSLTSISPDVNGDAAFNNALAYSWTLFSTGTAITGFSTDKFTINTGTFNGTNGFTNALGGGTFSLGLADGGTDINLSFTPVPEPNVAALLGGFGMLALLRRRR